MPHILLVVDLQVTRDRILAQRIGIAELDLHSLAFRVRAFIRPVLGDGKYLPFAGRSVPGERGDRTIRAPPLETGFRTPLRVVGPDPGEGERRWRRRADAARHGIGQVHAAALCKRPVGGKRPSDSPTERAGRHLHGRRLAALRRRYRDEIARVLQLGMPLQRQIPRRPGRIAALVVQPERHVRGLGEVDGVNELRPERLLVHIPLPDALPHSVRVYRPERHVARETAVSAIQHRRQLLFVVLDVEGIVVPDRQKTARARRIGEPLRTCPAVGRQRGAREHSHARRNCGKNCFKLYSCHKSSTFLEFGHPFRVESHPRQRKSTTVPRGLISSTPDPVM